MRLEKIKLAGFKSFVDPTLVLLESNLTAIVGPNGSGKSNIVDALRWVIGESSAKQLRGASLADVIFNGSTHRKPVGKASIELIFDNTQGRLGSAYANYNEISIKREITRDGQSVSYLNGIKCRKRDITDLFLGTGLGPSSYAIIEQGVISQLIESKPEELRTHFEEAAGISKYRERRKETETRIKNTRENLERLTDLREEIQKQLDRLKRQASAAERFKVLKQEQRLLKAQSHALEHLSLSQQIQQQNQQLNTHTTTLEGQIAAQRHTELNIEQTRVEQVDYQQSFNLVQAEFYNMGNNISEKEQSIKNTIQNKDQLAKDLASTERTLHDAEQHYQEDIAKIATLANELDNLLPNVAQAKATALQTQTKLTEAEETDRRKQSERDEFQAHLAGLAQKAKLEMSQAQHLQQKADNLEARIDKLKAQHQTLTSDMTPEELTILSDQANTLETTLNTLQARINTVQQDIQTQRHLNTEYQTNREASKDALQALQHKKVSLEALQHAAVKKHDPNTTEWLNQQGWSTRARLIDSLEVEAGWEVAVETALSPYLEAICTDTTEDFQTAAEHITSGNLILLNTNNTSISTPPHASNMLASKIKTPHAAHNLLQNIYIAENTTDALDLLPSLTHEASVITREGVWFSPHWVRINKRQDETAGILQRKQSIKEISERITAQEATLATHDEQLLQGKNTLTKLEEDRDLHQREFRETSHVHSELRAKLSAKQTELSQIQQRKTALDEDLKEQLEQLSQTNAQLMHTMDAAKQAQTEHEAHQQQKITLLQIQDLERTQINTLRQDARTHQQTANEYAARLSAIKDQQHYLEQNITRVQKQLEQIKEQRHILQTRQVEVLAPLPALEDDLQALLQKRLGIEKALSTVREQVSQTNQALETLEKQKAASEQQMQTLRDTLEKIRITQSSTQTRLENQIEQITDAGYTLAEAQEHLPQEATISSWQAKISDIDTKIQRLGLINLAAIEEYDELRQRKTYLDDQDKDLCDALATLEHAIQKIDQESRARLKETFEQANEHFKTLFSKMFNGGHAALEFIGNEVLTAGILIRAQPPGKRNTLLHMLSGGEKALTAIALVFALFQLNPAPFCVLDEVDAPLDDANVGRFCRLVEAMSSSVQFLFISHNKVTMEMAKQLVGVTMHEPGVSRLVSVDIDQAIAAIEK